MLAFSSSSYCHCSRQLHNLLVLTLIIGSDDGAIGAALVVIESDPLEWLVSSSAALVLDWNAAGTFAVFFVIETGLSPESVVVFVEHVMLSISVLDELHVAHEEFLFARI